MVVAAPIGIGAAIYLTEYARQDYLTNTIRFAIENLAGIPSIIKHLKLSKEKSLSLTMPLE